MRTYNVTEAAQLLGVHRGTLLRWIRDGKVAAERVGAAGHYRIPADQLRDITGGGAVNMTAESGAAVLAALLKLRQAFDGLEDAVQAAFSPAAAPAPTEAQVVGEVMEAYDAARAAWQAAKGDDFDEVEFHAWFSQQVDGEI